MKEKRTQTPFAARLAGHLKTVHEHRRLVRRYCFQCGLYYQGLVHDLSKYSPAEFWPSVRYYQGYRTPWDAQREAEGYAPGWIHHRGLNKHHYDYWFDSSKDGIVPVRMPYRYVIESVCDRVAASRIYKKDKYTPDAPLQYFLTTVGKQAMHPDTAAQFERILTMIAEEGEDAVFARIKQSLHDHTEL
ncbi:MAG: catalase [Solobacterium sp.]|nr:catalase [Solobacterium sp.]